jgi:hypothetical protein
LPCELHETERGERREEQERAEGAYIVVSQQMLCSPTTDKRVLFWLMLGSMLAACGCLGAGLYLASYTLQFKVKGVAPVVLCQLCHLSCIFALCALYLCVPVVLYPLSCALCTLYRTVVLPCTVFCALCTVPLDHSKPPLLFAALRRSNSWFDDSYLPV